MDRKYLIKTVLNNRMFITVCVMLILGTVFGTVLLGFLQENVCSNLFTFLSQKTDNFINLFINKFIFPFGILTGIYLSGYSIIGRFSAVFMVFINGMFFGFENALYYMYSGTNYILYAVISYFTATFYFGFFIILMAEKAIFDSKQIIKCLKMSEPEKTHYNAKNRTVKYIAFTSFTALFSFISVYLLKIIPFQN